jgi:hypothetical protein
MLFAWVLKRPKQGVFMKVEQSSYFQSLVESKQATQPKSDDFSAQLERQLLNVLKAQVVENTPSEDAIASEVEAFKQNLTSMGATQFFYNFNMEKIEKLLEEKRDSLEKTLGLDDEALVPLQGEKRDEALKSLDTMLESYAKQLREQMEALSMLESGESPLESFLRG